MRITKENKWVATQVLERLKVLTEAYSNRALENPNVHAAIMKEAVLFLHECDKIDEVIKLLRDTNPEMPEIDEHGMIALQSERKKNAELLEALKYVAANHHEGGGDLDAVVLKAIAKAKQI